VPHPHFHIYLLWYPGVTGGEYLEHPLIRSIEMLATDTVSF